MGITKLDYPIPEGAVRIHMYKYIDVLRPRGTMQKESLGAYILDRLEGAFENWTDEKYGDNPEVTMLLQQLHENLMEEVQNAWREFETRRCITDVPD